jgi:hypothetical protein
VTLGAQWAMALGLGQIQGNVWLGQGLDVRIPLQLDRNAPRKPLALAMG